MSYCLISQKKVYNCFIMRTIYKLIFAFTLISTASINSLQSQNLIRNGGFEDFVYNDTIPDFWNYVAFFSAPTGLECSGIGKFQLDNDAYEGNYAIKLETTQNEECRYEGNIMTYNDLAGSNNLSDYIPLNTVPDKFSFKYKYEPIGNDTAIFFMIFKYYNSSTKTVEKTDTLFYEITEEHSTYTEYSADLDFSEWENKPNYYTLFISSCRDLILPNILYYNNETACNVGTKLWIDDIRMFDKFSSIESMNPSFNITLYPNPVIDKLYINIKNKNVTGFIKNI